ncbi:MAG: aspartate carbamoyltransferase catalytic subunit [Methylacidiphilales bacterium]|nr:aspartate carbamoyltransferase catalytic subunit [Candidatus Methylacidiphilales bacterium]
MVGYRKALKSQITSFNQKNKLIHLLDLHDWNQDHFHTIFKLAKQFKNKSFLPKHDAILMANLFYEHSTRTLTSFEIAALYLGINVVNFSVLNSSKSKGENLQDTIENLYAMGISLFVLRHPRSGAPHSLVQHARFPYHIINAGDGEHAHPSQALIDCFTIEQNKGSISNLHITICGDILHSRVARSLIHAFTCFNVKSLTLCAPPSLMPIKLPSFPFTIEHALANAIDGRDVIINLRIQRERITHGAIPSTLEYFNTFGITSELLNKLSPTVMVLHPGPVNRGVELDDSVLKNQRSFILQQVSNATAIRMSIIHSILCNE